MKTLSTILLMAFLPLAFGACQTGEKPSSIAIENGYVRAPLPGQSTAVAYFDVVNVGGKDVLLAANSNVSSRVELHNHIHEGGMMKMVKVDTVDIPKGETVFFKSGGLHIMMFEANINGPVTLTLDFENHADITVELQPLN